jgi:hypothetical protein
MQCICDIHYTPELHEAQQAVEAPIRVVLKVNSYLFTTLCLQCVYHAHKPLLCVYIYRLRRRGVLLSPVQALCVLVADSSVQ